MKSANRDLLVLSRKASLDPSELQHEVELLHQILFYAETLNNFCVVTELIDVNRYRVINKPGRIEKIIRENKLKPFQFISNKN